MSKTVLVADDEVKVVSLLLATLGGDERYRVVVAKDGEEAVSVAKQEKPDLILLDILMPKLDGFQVCRLLRGDPATSRAMIVMLTALAQESDWHEAIQAGADDYLTKPFSPTEILEKIEDVCGEVA
ncbi:MAG: response regulator [Candidatus Latescibacteria bacterium]|nr:response regulator [Candidatus Latescibacterota bacterium]